MTDHSFDWKAARRICMLEARQVFGATDGAEDAAQEALVRAWRARHTCASPGRPEAWIAAIARNTARTHRTGAATRAAREPALPDRAEPPDHRAGEQLASIPDRLTVQHAVAQLSPADRKLVVLRYGADLTQKDIAGEMGWPEGTVKIRLHRLRRRLAHEFTSP